MPQENQNAVLTADRVTAIFADSLFKEGEPTEGYVPAQGVIRNVGFHPARVAGHKAEIGAMLSELPDDYMRSGGGGMSFLNACYDRHGNQWTGLHMTMEQLFQLGIATVQAEWLMPREMWSILPGGMPYAVVDVAA